MIEVEIKLPVKDRKRIEQGLLDLEFMTGHLMKESDTYFNSEAFNLRKKDMALRIRSCENITTGESKAVVTYKGPKLDDISMTRKELETEIADAGVCEQIFAGIGFQEVYPVRKLRQYYHYENVTACVDQVENLGDFLELEIIVEKEEEREKALLKLENILKDLGHSREETTRTSYLSMLQQQGGR